MTLFQSLVLGILQGLAEFLPISSSAHLALAPWLFGWPEPGLSFDVALHLGTLVAVLGYFRAEWVRLARAALNIARTRKVVTPEERRVLFLIIATIPGGIAGVLLDKYAEHAFRAPALIAGALMVMGVLLWLVDRAAPVTRSLDSIRGRDALLIGLAADVRDHPRRLALGFDDHGGPRARSRSRERRHVQLLDEHAHHRGGRTVQGAALAARGSTRDAIAGRSNRGRGQRVVRDRAIAALRDAPQLRRSSRPIGSCSARSCSRSWRTVVDQRGMSRLGANDTYDGRAGASLMQLLDLPRVEVFDSVTSTLDVAHALAESGAPAGTLVLAEEQTAGRGRGGRSWTSAPGAGILVTLLERPRDARVIDLLSLRVGLKAARVLDRFTVAPVQVKWPNDLFVGGEKLAGVLVEARWRDEKLEWVAIGIGINLRAPRALPAAALRGGTSRVEVLAELIPALRAAAAATGPLSARELADFAARDLARGRQCTEPAVGAVAGIDASGALLVTSAAGTTACRSGSLVFAEATA